MDAQNDSWIDLKSDIGLGFKKARSFCETPQGWEGLISTPTIVKYEYIVTVKIAEQLSRAERVVGVEVPFSTIRNCSGNEVRFSSLQSNKNIEDESLGFEAPRNWRRSFQAKRRKIAQTLMPYKFGKKDSKRVDVAIFDGENQRALAAIEIKLFRGSYSGFKEDIRRVSDLVAMRHELGLVFKGVATIFFQKKGGRSGEVLTLKQTARMERIKSEYAAKYPTLKFSLDTVCEGSDEPVIQQADPCNDVIEEVLKERVSYCGRAILVEIDPSQAASLGVQSWIEEK